MQNLQKKLLEKSGDWKIKQGKTKWKLELTLEMKKLTAGSNGCDGLYYFIHFNCE